MTSTDERDLDLVRKSARELARRFDLFISTSVLGLPGSY